MADYLSKKQEVILRQWEQEMKQDKAKSVELDMLSREGFRDNIPVFLERLNQALRHKKSSSETVAKEHGAHRWEYGLDLQQTMKEWSLLHKILMEQVNRYEESHSLSPPSLKEANSILANHIHQGVVFSVAEYNTLQQAESEAQFRDLKQALNASEEVSHAEDLRQTSHDLKGMVHILRTGFFLLKDKKFDDKTRETLDQMKEAADDLNQLLNDLLDLFRLEAGKEKANVKSFDAAKLLRDLCKSYQPLAEGEHLDLRCKGDKELQVRSDPKKVKRAVQNLVLNSLKYTRSGFVEIEWTLKEKDYWMIRIHDTGPGLGATHASSLTTKTDPSVSSEKSNEMSPSDANKNPAVHSHGEGIGLLIVRRLCEILNAVIKVDTKKDEGTTYRIVFPLDIDK
ncbi:MAG TPA: HAMP domain-containing sensor histidine kinase [Balneolaceae bacterium]